MDNAQNEAVTAAKNKTETVTLKCQHTHKRKVCQKGERITVPAKTAMSLRAQGIAE